MYFPSTHRCRRKYGKRLYTSFHKCVCLYSIMQIIVLSKHMLNVIVGRYPMCVPKHQYLRKKEDFSWHKFIYILWHLNFKVYISFFISLSIGLKSLIYLQFFDWEEGGGVKKYQSWRSVLDDMTAIAIYRAM